MKITPLYSFRSLEQWKILSRNENSFHAEGIIPVEQAGRYLLLYFPNGSRRAGVPFPEHITLNGKEIDLTRNADFAYCVSWRIQRSVEVECFSGENILCIKGSGSAPDLENFLLFELIPVMAPEEKVPPCSREFIPEQTDFSAFEKENAGEEDVDLSTYLPGCGTSPAPGRFAFLKGDGVLDCAMPLLGVVDKWYLKGHPRYERPFRWLYSTLPEGASLHGSQIPADTSIEGDSISVNPLSVRWQTSFGKETFSCTYSLGSPGILTEYSGNVMRISKLQFAGSYRYILIPRKNGKMEVCDPESVRDLTMGENFLLLFGCSSFPDVPLLLVFTKQPSSMEIKRTAAGQLESLTFGNCSALFTATPFGLESFDPISPEDDSFLKRAVSLCRFWSRAFLAYPVECKEYFKNDPACSVTEIVEKFSYRILEDEWGTKPLKLSVLPPASVLSSEKLQCAPGNQDLAFPTKYGPLYGRAGSVNSYTLPWMGSSDRRFPLEDDSFPEIRKKLAEGFDSYLDLVETYPETVQAYPYAGALMEPYAYSSPMMYFLDEPYREKIRTRLKERLKTACKVDHSYDYPVIHHSFMMRTMPEDAMLKEIYKDPGMAHKRLWNYYERTEPFSGIRYHVCYLNVSMLHSNIVKEGTPEEIRNLNTPLIENDWGCGLTFYYMVLSALACGDTSAIKENWSTLCSVFSFFEKMMDWACMGTGYSDSAILWVEGANYGAFNSFLRLAQMAGDPAAVERARYVASKQFALRRAVIRSGAHFFWKYFECKPYYITKFLFEEVSPFAAHTYIPELDENDFSYDGVYNLTTEGIYPELFEHLREAMGEEWDQILEKLKASIRSFPLSDGKDWIKMQVTASLLTALALDDRCSSEELKEWIRLAGEKNLLMKQWRGIHIYSRRLPENFFKCQLLAWDRMKNHKAWLLHWENIRIDTAKWLSSSSTAQVTFRRLSGKGLLLLGIRSKPEKVLLNGKTIPFRCSEKLLEAELACGGTLEVVFP